MNIAVKNHNLQDNLKLLTKGAEFSSFNTNVEDVQFLGEFKSSSRKPTYSFPTHRDGSVRKALSDIGQLELQIFRAKDSVFSPEKQRQQGFYEDFEISSMTRPNPSLRPPLYNNGIPAAASTTLSSTLPPRPAERPKSKVADLDTQMERALADFDLDGKISFTLRLLFIYLCYS